MCLKDKKESSIFINLFNSAKTITLHFIIKKISSQFINTSIRHKVIHYSKALLIVKYLSSKNLCSFRFFSFFGEKKVVIDWVPAGFLFVSSTSSKVHFAAFSCNINSAVDQLNRTSKGYPKTWSIWSRMNFLVRGSEINHKTYKKKHNTYRK